MTIRQEPTLWCDGVEDDTTPHGVRHAIGAFNPRFRNDGSCPHWVQNGQTAREIRANARRAGWKRVDGRDYSPECYQLLLRQTTAGGNE